MTSRSLWIALAVFALIILVLPVLGGGLVAWAGGPVAQGAGHWGWGSGWCGY